MTITEANKLIALCRKVDGLAGWPTWTSNDGEVMAPDGLYANFGNDHARAAAAIVLWRAGFGALLNRVEQVMKSEVSAWGVMSPLAEFALATLTAWADSEHPGWRER